MRICFESNTTSHLVDYEGKAERRPMTREELQRFFDYADDRVEQAARSGRKGALSAYRDATMFKVIYGWGLFSGGVVLVAGRGSTKIRVKPAMG